MAKWYYRCEVKGIQSFVMRGAKLQEIVGGSALVDALFSTPSDPHYRSSLLAQALNKILGPQADVKVLYCAAGGATLSFGDASGDSLRRWVAEWPLWVDENLPSMQLIQAWVHADVVQDQYSGDAVKALAERLSIARNLQRVELPQSTPVMDQGVRGGPASKSMKLKSSDNTAQFVDRLTEKQLNAARDDELQRRLRNRFFPSRNQGDYLPFPMDHEELSGPQHSYLAVIHIDGNRVGRLLPHFKDIEGFAAFSRALTEVTLASVDYACEALMPSHGERFILGRPVVVGGDDVTAIVRADRALEFTERFIKRFEERSKEVVHLPALKGKVQRLTASAGIAFVRRNHPFRDALHLAEELCKFSKKAWSDTDEGRVVPSLIAFQRVTSSLAEIDRPTATSPRFRLGPFYAEGEQQEASLQAAGFMCLRDIKLLAQAAQHRDVSQGRLRTIVDWVSQSRELRHDQLDPARAEREWMRIDQLHREREKRVEFWRGKDGVLGALKGLKMLDQDDQRSWAHGPWLRIPFPLSQRGGGRGGGQGPELRYASPWVDVYDLVGSGAVPPSHQDQDRA
jgi:hypothetical protein